MKEVELIQSIKLNSKNPEILRSYDPTVPNNLEGMRQVATKWNTELYTDKHAFVHEYGKSLIGLLDPKKNERILDLGCGPGQLTNDIGNFARDVLGMDSSQEMLEKARSNYPLLTFQLGDAANFHMEEKFDAIFSNATLHWVLAFEEAIKCMHSNLKNGGRLVVEFGGKGNVDLIVGQLRQSLEKRGYWAQSKLNLWYFPSIAEYTTALESKGFEVTFAQLYERPTELSDKKEGIIDWLRMFGLSFFKEVPESDINQITREVQKNLRPFLFKNGKWYADYKRLRVIAIKK